MSHARLTAAGVVPAAGSPARAGRAAEITALDGSPWCLSWSDAAESADPIAVAAALNNHLMVRGVRGELGFSGAAARGPVPQALAGRYPQVFSLRPPPSPPTPRAGVRTCGAWSRPGIRTTVEGHAVGINVGQSYLKAVLVRGDGSVLERRRTESRLDAGPSALSETVLDVARSLCAPGTAAVALATGGIVTDGRIWPGSGITAGLTEAGYAEIEALPQRLSECLGLPVLVTQDARAKAFAHLARDGQGDTLVLDLGTSLGAAFVDSRRSVPVLLNQVGRLACDLGDAARVRPDGQATGVASQYLSASGLATDLRASGLSVAGSTAIEEVLAGDSEAARPAWSELIRRLAEIDALARTAYRHRHLLLTGGLVAGLPAGAAGELDRALPAESVSVSPEPVFDAAIGAAVGALVAHPGPGATRGP